MALGVCGVPQEVTQSPRCQDAPTRPETVQEESLCGLQAGEGAALGREGGHPGGGGDGRLWWRTTLSTNSTSKVNLQPLLNVPRCPHPPPQPQPMHGSESHGAHPSLFPSLPAAPAQPPRPQTLVPASPQRPDSRPGPSFPAHTVAHCSPESVISANYLPIK